MTEPLEPQPYRPPPRPAGELRGMMLIWGFIAVMILGAGAGMFWLLTREPDEAADPTALNAAKKQAASDQTSSPSPPPTVLTGPAPPALRPEPWQADGAFFATRPANPAAPVTVNVLDMPVLKGCDAIWGSVGRDARGHIWLGVSQRGEGSAVLMEYDPDANAFIHRGRVIDALRSAGLDRPGMSQVKIHSRIVQARDGHLYFTSMDEAGENAATSTPPKWGSHLWRVRLPEARWEHLAAVPDALIALSSGSGNRLYMLGYWGHVVYQYDLKTKQVQSVKVGSEGGHISRNVISDARDHVYVPRFKMEPNGKTGYATLVELDDKMNEVAETPLEHYGKSPASHGIVGFQPMSDGVIVFITSEGYLYRIRPGFKRNRPATIEPIGYMHPQGQRYIASLHTYDGLRYVLGCNPSEWMVYDLLTDKSIVTALDLRYPDNRNTTKHLLYGSVARDSDGRFYIVGIDQQIYQPVVLRLSVSD